jgi:uncharacterized protein YfbU (UPF0304 family)
MPRIKLTDAERLILANQYEILSALQKDEDYARMAETLRDGHEWLYRQYFDSLSENLPDDKVTYVLRVLDIFRNMNNSYRELADKSGIDERDLAFRGFDGNNESDLLSFAEALRKDGRFTETIGPTAKNSHMPTTAICERMIDTWRELGEPNYPYTREQIVAIVEARTHPDRK